MSLRKGRGFLTMIKGVIFDFDGLIIDTESVWFDSFKEVLLEMHTVELDLVRYSACIGTGNDVLFELFNSIIGKQVNGEEIQRYALQKFREKMHTPILREGVKEYLEDAKHNNLTIGLASSSSRNWVCDYLEQLNILNYFNVINTKDDVMNVKPDPELYLKTLRECNLLSSEAIAFEDSVNGLTAAKQACIRCVIVPNPVTQNLPFEDYDFRLETMKQERIIEVINKVSKF